MADDRQQFRLSTVLLTVCLLVALAGASDFWTKKPYQNWSADETQRMLAESP